MGVTRDDRASTEPLKEGTPPPRARLSSSGTAFIIYAKNVFHMARDSIVEA